MEFLIHDIVVNSDLSLNQAYAAGKKQAFKRSRDKTMVKNIVAQIIRKMSPPPKIFEVPVDIIIDYDTRLDIDNCSYLSKMIIDGMKKKVIKDDTKRYVRSLTQRHWSGGCIRVQLIPAKGGEDGDG